MEVEDYKKLLFEDYKNNFSRYQAQLARLANLFTLISFAAIAFDIQFLDKNIPILTSLTILSTPGLAILTLIIGYFISNQICEQYSQMIIKNFNGENVNLLSINYVTSLINCNSLDLI